MADRVQGGERPPQTPTKVRVPSLVDASPLLRQRLTGTPHKVKLKPELDVNGKHAKTPQPSLKKLGKAKAETPRSIRKLQRKRQLEAMLEDNHIQDGTEYDITVLDGEMNAYSRASSSSSDDESMPTTQSVERDGSIDYLARLQEAPHERYFVLMKDSVKASSSMSHLPSIDAQTYLEVLSREKEWTPARIRQGQETLMHNYLDPRYSQEIICQGLCGFNTLLQGYGSKRAILNNIAHRLTEQGYACLVINGFFPGLRVVHVVNDIAKFVNVTFEKGGALTAAELTSQIAERYSDTTLREQPRLFILVHSIDAEPVRSPAFQGTFAKLAAAERIHFIASSDHINAQLLWPPPLDDQFAWLPRNATTFVPYDLELRFELLGGSISGVKGTRDGGLASIVGRGDGANSVAGILHVMEALPDKTIKIFQILAKYLLQNSSPNPTEVGVMTFDSLFAKASEDFLVQRPELLRTMLNELRDHEIIISGRAPDGTETLTIPLESNVLKELMDELTSR